VAGRTVLIAFVFSLLALGSCLQRPPAEISRERAVEIARSQVTFPVTSIDAVKASANGQPIWRVTVRGRLPDQPPLLFETRVFEIERRTGQIVAVSRA
jgi:peptidase YpeB-like protein